jgi:hypothetical protein
MKIVPQFRVGVYEYSHTLNEQLFCEEAKGIVWAGGWRLPTVEELVLLYNEQPDSRCSELYWTDTLLRCVNFEDGEDYIKMEDSAENVRLVRVSGGMYGP